MTARSMSENFPRTLGRIATRSMLPTDALTSGPLLELIEKWLDQKITSCSTKPTVGSMCFANRAPRSADSTAAFALPVLLAPIRQQVAKVSGEP